MIAQANLYNNNLLARLKFILLTKLHDVLIEIQCLYYNVYLDVKDTKSIKTLKHIFSDNKYTFKKHEASIKFNNAVKCVKPLYKLKTSHKQIVFLIAFHA